MSLHTGKRIHGFIWDELPIDEYVIERVESLATEQGQPLMSDGTPIFEWTPGQQIKDMWSEELGGATEEEGTIPPVIENGILEVDEVNEAAGPDIEEEQDIIMEDSEDEEGLMVIPEDNIVCDEEAFIEDESDRINDVEAEAPQDVTVEEAVVADVDDVPMTYDRPRRNNA